MRTCHASLAILLSAALLSPAADTDDAAKLKASLAKWEKARTDYGGDYTLIVRWSSAFGFGHQTTLVVKANKVVERRYEVIARPEPGQVPMPKVQWTEKGNDLGKNKTEGAPVRTLDEIYAEAKKLLEMEVPKDHVRSLGFDKQGLLNYCFTRDTRIADDAPQRGIAPFQIQFQQPR